MGDNLKLLRYNTGTDKKVLIKFKDDFDAVIFNAAIVAYSRSAVADLVSIYKNQYIIDPQTHIFQQDVNSIKTNTKNGETQIKKSVYLYLEQLPKGLVKKFYDNNGFLKTEDVIEYTDELVNCVFEFETNYVNKYITKKEYDKYLEFANIGPSAKIAIAPYFMIKQSYNDEEIKSWMSLNRVMVDKFIEKVNGLYDVGIQIVIDFNVLSNDIFIQELKEKCKDLNVKYAFIWVDNLNLFDAPKNENIQFEKILKILTEAHIKPIMAYGGYDSILLCNKHLRYRMYGVAQSVGYGESRAITPVGGGIPVNKYYFLPLHKRMRMMDVILILKNNGFFDGNSPHMRFYDEICSCNQCKKIILNDINNFAKYNESTTFKISGNITRNRPTTNASFISAMHFMYSKVSEWKSVENNNFSDLVSDIIDNYNKYQPYCCINIKDWCTIYE